jgi:hypothetical protein
MIRYGDHLLGKDLEDDQFADSAHAFDGLLDFGPGACRHLACAGFAEKQPSDDRNQDPDNDSVKKFQQMLPSDWRVCPMLGKRCISYTCFQGLNPYYSVSGLGGFPSHIAP